MYLTTFAGLFCDEIVITKGCSASLPPVRRRDIGMAPPLKLNAVAFISPQNHPILIRTFAKDDLKYHYIAHTSLDVIEERGERSCVVFSVDLDALADL